MMEENDIKDEVNETELINGEFPMIAKTMAELEDVLAEELIGLGANNVEIGTRMVSFTGDKALLYKANLHCRTASRILKPIYNFKADSADEVYVAIKLLNWDDYLTLDKTFSIDAVVFSHIFTHSKFVAYKVKDAIADWFVEKYTKRPSVSVSNPDLIFNIHISHNKCTLSLDSSGESLHKRGYRIDQTEAPLSEVLAAGMILKSGWRGESAFLDPMCGSGTILIEAAMIALGIPPGIHRKNFAFEKWNNFDSDLFSDIYNDDSGLKELKFPIIGSDISPKAISISEKNIKKPTVYFLIDLNIDPVKYPYNIRIDNDTKKSDSKNLGYFVIPDVILIKKDNLYRIIKFPRGINNSEFHEILKSTQATYISELEIQGTLEGYESMGIFGVKNDFSSIFQRLKSREIVNVVNK